MNETVRVDEKDRALLQWLQDEFPVTGRPWRSGAARLGMSEEEVVNRVRRLSEAGVIRSVHTILDKQKAGPGSSTLVAMKVPEEKIQDVVPVINEYPPVTHNYLREHKYNLWFTVNAGNERELTAILDEMKRRTGVSDADLLDLRTRRVFKTDVRFRFCEKARATRNRRNPGKSPGETDETDRAILSMTQKAIPLVDEPFREISEQLGLEHREVLARIRRRVRDGMIKRIGSSVNQRKLGIVANAVVAWKVPDDLVEEAGEKLSSFNEVTHCYERSTVPGVWEYNMFTVLHGYDRPSVEAYAKRLSGMIGIDDYRVIFSTIQFKRMSIIHDIQTIPPR